MVLPALNRNMVGHHTIGLANDQNAGKKVQWILGQLAKRFEYRAEIADAAELREDDEAILESKRKWLKPGDQPLKINLTVTSFHTRMYV